MEKLAAREVRRYVYLRTGKLLPIVSSGNPRASILVARDDRPLVREALGAPGAKLLATLKPETYWIKTAPDGVSMLVTGADDSAVLFGAYRFAEILGMRFYLDGDVVPDHQVKWKLPAVDEKATPLFPIRGIQPFHDFPEGPDWWDTEDYLAIIGQLPKLRMNFIGLHTYPEGHPNAEPTVWLGLEQDVGLKGEVKFAYPSSYMNTLRGNWGYTPQKTSEFVCGSAMLFDRDDYGPEVMYGFMPQPDTPEGSKIVFDRTGRMLRRAFGFAHEVGVRTCVGTETPLVIPALLKERLDKLDKPTNDLTITEALYEGIFRRVARTYPLDYYWFWTPESWTWSGTKDENIARTTNDLFAAIAAHDKLKSPFKLATCGWVLGPQQDRALFDKVLPTQVAMSCINREVGKTPVEPGFAEVTGRSKWAIPWMEDDSALTSLQLWVGRMRRDAADALRYGCDGLLGIHWRTRVLGPNVSALAQAAWKQTPWVEHYHPEQAPQASSASGPIGGQLASFPGHAIAGTEQPAVYQTVRYNLSGYRLAVPNGPCKVTLKFCEPHYDAAGKRVFDVKLQGVTVITNLDIFARVGQDQALDFTFDKIQVTNGWLYIAFQPRIEYPSIAGIVVEGNGFARRINCGGPALDGYAADGPPAPAPRQVYAATDDFYADWAAHQFGSEAGPEAAAIFTRVDCALPIPSTWVGGPGGIRPNPRPWDEVKAAYAFVDQFAALAPKIRGQGNRARYEYWLNTLLYLRDIAEVNCAWAEFNHALDKVKQEKDNSRQKSLAKETALPARLKLVALVNELFEHLLGTVSTTGELGTVANWNQHNLPALLTSPGKELAGLLGEPLPVAAEPATKYHGPIRIIVPTKRTSLDAGETFQLKVIILSENPPQSAVLSWRNLGARRFSETPLRQSARGVYWAEIPEPPSDDFEYFVKVSDRGGNAVMFPPTAPALNQTVVLAAQNP